MVDRPDYKPTDNVGNQQSNDNTSSLNSLDFQWTPADRAGGRTTVTDRAAQPEHGVLTLQYGDPNFDQKLQSGGYDQLQIAGFPQGVGVSSWLDQNGVFFWYNNGTDNRTHHYLPPGLKTIVINGVRQDCDEMRLEATQAYLQEQDHSGVGFTAIDQHTDPLDFAQRLASISNDALALEERTLAQAASNSPANPYFRIYHADIILAEAFKPVMEQVFSGQNQITLNSPYTLKGIDMALQELNVAANIASQQPGAGAVDVTPGLYPFALNPDYYDPDAYWGGALYQAQQRSLTLTVLKQFIEHAPPLELPPAMPPG